MPAEILFDAIEAELERRGVERSWRDHSLRELSGTALLSERNRGGRLASFLTRENNR
jgi:hypothetical protein